ncbi:MAG TPA: hypothetical protein VF503_00130 [Sphingobium sp.]|uniref:hypothetical protein n=1 Tax=Sphingobium sp. TaxID=1912891 RepID=UPI002ED494FC
MIYIEAGMRNAERCADTRSKIIRCCLYMKSDRQIAQHVGVRIEFVAKVRAGLADHEDACRRRTREIVSHNRGAHEGDGGGEYYEFRRKTRKSSERLAAALAGMAA